MEALLYFDEMQNVNVCKWKFVDKRMQANEHCSKYLSPGFTLRFAFCQNKATDPMYKYIGSISI